MSELARKIDEIIRKISPEAQKGLDELMVYKEVGKESFLLAEEQVCQNCFLIEEGVARKFTYSGDKEFTTELYFKDDLAVSFESFCYQKPSTEYIQAITDLKVIQINFNSFQKLKSEFPELVQLDLVIAEYYTIWLEKRFMEFRTQSATERYRNLLTREPRFLKHLKLTIIASYLGISLETLSRIRSKV